MSIRFYLHRKDQYNEHQIRVSICIRGQRFVTSIGKGFKIEENQWDKINGRVKKGSKNRRGFTSFEINEYIAKIEMHFFSFENEIYKKGKQKMLPNFIKDEWLLVFSNRAQISLNKNYFFECFDEFIYQEGIVLNWKPKTRLKFEKIRLRIEKFDPGIRFEDINEVYLAKYTLYLLNNCKLINTTVKKHIVHLKQFFRWAVKHEKIQNSPILTWKPKLETNRNTVIFLDWDELMLLYNYTFPPAEAALDRVRDCFCLQCFTGLRYSDLHNLKKSDIHEDTIDITTIKTSETLRIELNKYARAILDKYKKVRFRKQRAMPTLSNQQMNSYLKDICKRIGLNQPVRISFFKGQNRIDKVLPKYELIKTHCGRRTFICNALMLGIPPATIMKWTGHSDYNSMKPYIEIADKTKAEAMKLFNR